MLKYFLIVLALVTVTVDALHGMRGYRPLNEKAKCVNPHSEASLVNTYRYLRSNTSWFRARNYMTDNKMDIKKVVFDGEKEQREKEIAASKGFKEPEALQVDACVNINAKNSYGTTALMQAAIEGQWEVIALLIEKGADINAKDKYGNSAFLLAAESGHKKAVVLLIEKGANVNAKNSFAETALMKAAANGHKEVVSLLLEKGADVNAKDFVGGTALTEAAKKGCNKEVIGDLLENGADIKAKGRSGNAALIADHMLFIYCPLTFFTLWVYVLAH